MAGSPSETSSGNKLIWWLFSIGSGMLLLLVSVLMTKLERIGDRLNALESLVSTQNERVKGIDALITETRREQVERTFRFGDLNTKIQALEYAQKYLHERYTTMSERLLTINSRLDSVKAKPMAPDY